MQLIQILLPLYDNAGAAQPRALFGQVREELTETFGGLTAFTRAPAVGLWEDEHDHVERDEIVIFEVVAEDLDRDWWRALRQRLERDFGQDEILIRATGAERL